MSVMSLQDCGIKWPSSWKRIVVAYSGPGHKVVVEKPASVNDSALSSCLCTRLKNNKKTNKLKAILIASKELTDSRFLKIQTEIHKIAQ